MKILLIAPPGQALLNMDVMKETGCGQSLIRQHSELQNVNPCAFSMHLVTGVVM